MKSRHLDFLNHIKSFIPSQRIYTDYLRRLAWGTDAGFYRLTPQIVVRSNEEQEVAEIIRAAAQFDVPLTFRAAGTSLSGQSVSDSVLVVAGKNWEDYEVLDGGRAIRLQPGVIGAKVSEVLKPYGYRFSPDPASVKSAMVGGIVMNNASGMNCGTHANSDRMLLSMRIIFSDGTMLDTGSEESRRAFAATHHDFISTLEALRDEVRADEALTARIRQKYAIKNVVGLNLLPLVAYDDVFDIIAHLMVGSEGTLAFMSEVTMLSERDFEHKACAMLYIDSIREACKAVVAMRQLTDSDGERIVHSAELLDAKSLASVNDTTGVGLTAVLTETKAHTAEELQTNIATIEHKLKEFKLYKAAHFSTDAALQAKYWAIRSGIFPSVGGSRRAGTTSLIEDIAFPIEHLPEATAELAELLNKYGYDDACIYGHALEGNYHFIINQSFSTESEVARYEQLMEQVANLVINKYDGSLKAEHGTGRNMAPYVKREWGDKAFDIMRRIKRLFDEKGILNPGVIFNDDERCHLANFKPLPLTNTLVDRCIECGFCEVQCVSCGLTLSSRQRIVIRREIARLKASGENPTLLKELEKGYKYLGEESCAGDGLCSTSCPLGINMGELTHLLRAENHPQGSVTHRIGDFAANHFAEVKSSLRPLLWLADTAHRTLGERAMSGIASAMHSAGLPRWQPSMPLAYHIPQAIVKAHSAEKAQDNEKPKVVYYPSCINQTMGTDHCHRHDAAQVEEMLSLLHKAGYEVIFPEGMENLCCGTIWESKGMSDIADRKIAELEEALWRASDAGRYPVLCDQSPCLHHMREKILRIKLYEPAEFILEYLCDRLTFEPIDTTVALHITCSMRRMGLAEKIISLAKMCAREVVLPEGVGCCGFAGDKGFTNPELNAYALRKLRSAVEKSGATEGYSNSRTCEIGLTTHSGIEYRSIAYLVDRCTRQRDLSAK
ncbi:MAG: FAD-binding oxidoreductase [Alistipes sp.]|nr:FAD-binding oxidoreductase [Alistipes sp.]